MSSVIVLFVVKPYVAQSQQMVLFSPFAPLFPLVVILFSSSRSVSANNWVTLMGHGMCGARLPARCSCDAARWRGERKPCGSCCCCLSLLVDFSTLVASIARCFHLSSEPAVPQSVSVHQRPSCSFAPVGTVVGGDKESRPRSVCTSVAASDEKHCSLQLGVLKRRL